MKYNKIKQAYTEILEVVKKHRDICCYDISDLERKAEKHLFKIELKEKYGIDLGYNEVYSMEYININRNMSIGWWGRKYNRTVPWEDNGKQPKDELLLCLGFSTGAYIFGEDYPTEFFKKFWQELKTYSPKYIDSHNNDLLFSMDNAANIFNDYPGILEKYKKRNEKESRQRKIKKLKDELDALKK